jgi:transcriptional regulator with XRE-family HTH domain
MTKLAPSDSVPTLARRLRDVLRDARLRKHLSRQDLEERTGISVNTLAKYESTDQQPSPGKLAALCMALEIDPREALRFALGEGEGEHLQQKDPQLWQRYDRFLKGLEALNPRSLGQAIGEVRAVLDMIELVMRHADPALLQHTGSLNDFITNALPQGMTGMARGMLGDEKFLAMLSPEGREEAEKSGPDRKDPSRSPENHQPKKLEAVGAAASPKRSRRRKPK